MVNVLGLKLVSTVVAEPLSSLFGLINTHQTSASVYQLIFHASIIHPSIHPCIHPCTRPSNHPSVHLFTHSFIQPLTVSLADHLPIHSHVHPPDHPTARQSNHPLEIFFPNCSNLSEKKNNNKKQKNSRTLMRLCYCCHGDEG